MDYAGSTAGGKPGLHQVRMCSWNEDQESHMDSWLRYLSEVPPIFCRDAWSKSIPSSELGSGVCTTHFWYDTAPASITLPLQKR